MLALLFGLNIAAHWALIAAGLVGAGAAFLYLPGRLGGLLAACGVALAVLTFSLDEGFRAGARACAAAQKDATIRAQAALAAEVARRDAAFAAARIDADMRANRLAQDLEALRAQQRKDDDASHAHDAAPCLDPGGVRRLNAVGSADRGPRGPRPPAGR